MTMNMQNTAAQAQKRCCFKELSSFRARFLKSLGTFDQYSGKDRPCLFQIRPRRPVSDIFIYCPGVMP